MKKTARDIAVSAITAFRKRDAWSDGFLRNEIRSANLDKRDAALATEIVNGTLQNMLLINHYISGMSSLKINKISPGILDIMQTAVYQIIFLDRVPDSAAVNDAVSRAKRNNARAAGFVNAVLRKISQCKNNLPEISGKDTDVLSVKYSHPKWLTKELAAVYGKELCESILAENNKKADTVIRVNTLKTDELNLTESLNEEGVSAKQGLIPNSLVLNSPGNIEAGKSFSEGCFFVQDTASQLAAVALSPSENSSVLDACAAPGGKTFALAGLMKNSGSILSCDIYAHKLELIKKGAERLGITSVKTELCDAAEYNAAFDASFDYILADVPCSGLGIIRKKPDIRYKQKEEIENLPELQLKILNNVSRYLKPGGEMVYSTCTVLPRENADVIHKFLLENGNFEEVECSFGVKTIKNEHGNTFIPPVSGTDGFYVCKLRRSK